MATGQENQEGAAENLRKKLAIAVKSIQWSYAIFWSISSRQPGVLEWGDGYYNGDIKTRKTVQAAELKADQLGLQRTEQLRELFESLSAAETNPQARRPSAALSPEDLTDTEWYFLVCMSFMFSTGQGIPGRTFANNKTIWLCNAHYADSKVFSRSLLAKSASIQTVVCLPYFGGVVELGITEKVLEDHKIIQQIKTSFSEIPYRNISKISNYASERTRNEKDFEHCIVESNLDPMVECEGVKNCSPQNSSNGVDTNQQAEESFIVEGINVGNSQLQSWQFMDDEVSNCVDNAMSSSDSIYQNLTSPENAVSLLNEENVKKDRSSARDSRHYTVCDGSKPSIDFRSDDIHYQSVLSTLFKSTGQLVLGLHFGNCDSESSFVSWKKGGFYDKQTSRGGTSQLLLKKALFEVAKMHGNYLLESREENGRRERPWRLEIDETDANHVLSERRRRERINQQFSILGSLVPSIGKCDKVSVLDGTIEYLKELERKVEELKSGKEAGEREARRRKKPPRDVVERTSDNYGDDEIGNMVHKRKTCEFEVIEKENQALPKVSSSDKIAVSIVEKNVLIEIRCFWRENLLLEIMDATSNLHLDSHSVQSSIVDGILSLSIGSKLKGSTLASVWMISQALQRVIGKC